MLSLSTQVLCRPDQGECIATDSKCSMQQIARHLGEPALTARDCHWYMRYASYRTATQRARVRTDTVKVKSHIGIHRSQLADKL